MQAYKKNFIEFLLNKEALKIGEFELKSGRMSPYFINTGMFDDGKSIGKLGYFYAAKIADRFRPEEFDIIFGPAYKGVPLAVTTAIALSKDFDINKGYAFNRKEPKDHGEATKQEATKQEKQKNWIVGHKIKDGDKIIMLDDVFTTGKTKYEAIDLLDSVTDYIYTAGLIIAVDRQEVGTDGTSAIQQFEEKTKIPVDSIVSISEIIEYLWSNKRITQPDRQRLEDYLKEFGIEEVRRNL